MLKGDLMSIFIFCKTTFNSYSNKLKFHNMILQIEYRSNLINNLLQIYITFDQLTILTCLAFQIILRQKKEVRDLQNCT